MPPAAPSLSIRCCLAVALAATLPAARTLAADESASSPQDHTAHFLAHVEPLLREHCYSCHSHTAGTMEAGLTLDWRSGWEQGGKRGPAVIPGNPGASLLIQAVRHQHPELKMPEDQLPPAEIAVLEEWVRNGAHDPRTNLPESTPIDTNWWSLRPLEQPAIPETDAAHTNPVDAFLQNSWRLAGVQPAPQADRRTLIRRLTLELHGLLPTPEETDAFINDPDTNAFNNLLERLLASPRYGERWARHWMDVIHFADSHGYEHDVFRPHAWRFRDYLIDSFNNDLPWPQFIREQLAADVFVPHQPQRQAALGFLGAGTYDHSAAATAPKNFENLDRDDLVVQTLTAFTSTTVGCARCHDHKFDPVSQTDYYSLQAVFAGIGKGDIPFDANPDIAAARLRWQHLKTAALNRDPAVIMAAEQQAVITAWLNQQPPTDIWKTAELQTFTSTSGAQLQRLEDGSLLAAGTRPDTDTTVLTISPESLTQVTALRLDVLPHPSLPANGPGRAENGNLHLNSVELKVFSPSLPQPQTAPFSIAAADFQQDGWTIAHAIDNDPQTAWGIHPQEGRPHSAVFELQNPIQIQPGTALQLSLQQTHGRGHTIGRFKISLANGPPGSVLPMPAEVQALLELKPLDRSPQQTLELHARILELLADAELAKLPQPEKLYAAAAVATNERGTIRFEKPREIRVLKRGDVDQPGDLVTPGTLAALEHVTGLPGRFPIQPDQPESARRAALAEWIASPANPLTWRSAANRVWQYHFGRGLCNTPSDFGRMGSNPDHPELLDWLACELRRSGSLKQLHRIICQSNAWKATAAANTHLLETDPENKLAAHRSRQRLDADAWRDSVLLASGRLDFTMYGPAVAHFSSRPGAQLTPILDYSTVDWNSPGMTRRSIYRVVWRGIPDPLLEQLDFPDLGLPTPVRSQSVSPLQALTLLNNRFVLHHAEHLAHRAVQAGPTVESQVSAATALTWQRPPSPAELDRLARLARSHGMAAVARLLLNSNEFLVVD